MRKWALPLTFFGLGGLGALLFSPPGRRLIRSAAERFGTTPERLADWNDSAQRELNHIQQAIEAIEQSLGSHPAH